PAEARSTTDACVQAGSSPRCWVNDICDRIRGTELLPIIATPDESDNHKVPTYCCVLDCSKAPPCYQSATGKIRPCGKRFLHSHHTKETERRPPADVSPTARMRSWRCSLKI